MAGAHEIRIDKSGFDQQAGKLYCPNINLSYNQANFLSGDCIKYSWKEIYNSKIHIKL